MFFGHSRSHLYWTDRIFCWLLGSCPGSNFPCFFTTHPECLRLLPCHAICHPVAKPTTVHTPPIHKSLCLFCSRNHPGAYTEISRCRSRISSNWSSRGRFRGLQGCQSSGEIEPFCSSFIQSSCFCSLLADLIVPLLANCHECRSSSDISLYVKKILHFQGQPLPMGILQHQRIPIKISGKNLKSTIVLRKLAVLLLNIMHFLFSSG